MVGPPLVQLALSCLVLTIPLFFAGGALFGGVMEYNSMDFGFAFLYLLALGFCALAWAFSWGGFQRRVLLSQPQNP